MAAIDAFQDLLPAHRTAWFRKQLRRLRRAAGDARDLDVLTDRLRMQPAAGSRPPDRREPGLRARDRLVAMLSRQRVESRHPIREIHARLVAADWPGRVERLLDGIACGRGRRSFGAYARRRLKPLIERFFAEADRRLRDDDEIHQVRIEGKKLRYALEIFAGVYPPRARARCQESLERLQEMLGEFTDHASAADRLDRWSSRGGSHADRSTLAQLRRQEADLAKKARKNFSKWWNPARRRALRRTFERSLRRESA